MTFLHLEKSFDSSKLVVTLTTAEQLTGDLKRKLIDANKSVKDLKRHKSAFNLQFPLSEMSLRDGRKGEL